MKFNAVKTFTVLASLLIVSCGAKTSSKTSSFKDISEDEFMERALESSSTKMKISHFVISGTEFNLQLGKTIKRENIHIYTYKEGGETHLDSGRYVSSALKELSDKVYNLTASEFGSDGYRWMVNNKGLLRTYQKFEAGLDTYNLIYTFNEFAKVTSVTYELAPTTVPAIVSRVVIPNPSLFDVKVTYFEGAYTGDYYLTQVINPGCGYFASTNDIYSETKVKLGEKVSKYKDILEKPILYYDSSYHYYDIDGDESSDYFEDFKDETIRDLDFILGVSLHEKEELATNYMIFGNSSTLSKAPVTSTLTVAFELDLEKKESKDNWFISWGDGAFEKIDSGNKTVAFTHTYTKSPIQAYEIHFAADFTGIRFAPGVNNDKIEVLKLKPKLSRVSPSFFENLKGLKELELNVNTIEKDTFAGNELLNKVVLHNTTRVNMNAFKDCVNLDVLDLMDSNALYVVGSYAFATDNPNKTKIYLPVYSKEEVSELFDSLATGDEEFEKYIYANRPYLIYRINPSNTTYEQDFGGGETKLYSAYLNKDKPYKFSISIKDDKILADYVNVYSDVTLKTKIASTTADTESWNCNISGVSRIVIEIYNPFISTSYAFSLAEEVK